MIRKYPPFLDSSFLRLLDEFDLDQLESDAGTIYGLWPDLTLAYRNPAWAGFAADNGGEPAISSDWSLGSYVIDAVAEPLRPFYIDNYGRCLREARPWEHAYQCTSAEQHQDFHTIVFPLGCGDGLLVVNSLQIDAERNKFPRLSLEQWYRNRNGLISQCCHCRRIRRIRDKPLWDWIPAWAREHPDQTTHGLCAACSGFYYAKARWNMPSIVQPFSTICA